MSTQLSNNNATNIDTIDSNSIDNNRGNETNEFTVSIFRFKFSDCFVNELYKFSKIHQYDHRKDFKSAWDTWLEENEELVNEETQRLSRLGYDGDAEDKMFKSARYYFRKKSTEKKNHKREKITQA